MIRMLLLLIACLTGCFLKAQQTLSVEVLVIGGGTGGTAAGIQSARLGANTLVVESSPWLGGMISAAGVSATDGNHRLPSGLWAEFRNEVYKVYGGPGAVETGWVSNTQFEPHVADSIFKRMVAAEQKLVVRLNCTFQSLQKQGNRIQGVIFKDRATGQTLKVTAKIYIDATELGDVLKAAGAAYDLGMEANAVTGENVGVAASNNIVQDLTWVAVLKDYGPGADKTIPRPQGYDPAEFDGACTDYYRDKSRKAPTVDAKKMLDYGRLPKGKYMLNWPGYGNDTYLNVVELTEAQRERELQKAKQTTLRFVYFIQQQLGFKNLGPADDEFPAADGLALMPYHRESRRVKGLVRLTMRHIAEPFSYGDPLYRTGISVGDYPIDHHHKKNPDAPQHLEFHPIPSYNVPLGALIPQGVSNLVIAEKSISVSNVANGTTRLQPVVLLTGQAAGTLAALAAKKSTAPKNIPVRTVQQALLNAKAYLMPYLDVTPENPHWEAVQKIGATGLLKGSGVPYKWANQTWFYPDSLVDAGKLASDVQAFANGRYRFASSTVTTAEAIGLAHQLRPKNKSFLSKEKFHKWVQANWENWGLKNFAAGRHLTRLELAVLLNRTLDPFATKAIDHQGDYKTK